MKSKTGDTVARKHGLEEAMCLPALSASPCPRLSASPRLRVPTLVIGYGNPDREDDGVAFHIIDSLRRRLGLPAIDADFAGIQPSGGKIDPVFVSQLAPEHLSTASRYGRMIFVDAHLPSFPENIRFERIHPGNGFTPVTHHLSSEAFLSWLKAIYGHAPKGYLLSVKAHRFDFSPTLTQATRALVEPAVDVVMGFLA